MKRIAFVTGVTSGIGKSLVIELLKKGGIVIGVGRSEAKLNALEAELKALDFTHFFPIQGSLNSNQEVSELVAKTKTLLSDKKWQLTDLCHIAGQVNSKKQRSPDNHELTFQVNHLAVVNLTHQLLPFMVKALSSRIIVVSSLSHYRARLDFNNLESLRGYNIMRAYQRSKLYNVLFVKGFSKKYPQIPIFAIDPGLVKTPIGTKQTSKLASFIWRWRSKRGDSPLRSAKHMTTIIYDASFNQHSGAYVKHGQIVPANPLTEEAANVDRFWDITLKMLHIQGDFGQ